ncbi:MAG TPA: hypothetical protein VGM44_08460, partial [Polyangiaceae bacterium]
AACGGTASGAASPSAAPNTASAVTPSLSPGAPPRPAATDWKGLFDSDSQSVNVAPALEAVAGVLRRQPDCQRVATTAPGSFTAMGQAEQAYLLECGATHRVVIADDAHDLVSLDLAEDTLTAAGDMDWNGTDELLVIGHHGAALTVRALSAVGGKLKPVYEFDGTPEACARIAIFYRFVKPNLEFRLEKPAKRCAAG